MAHLKKISMPPLSLKMPPLGEAKGGHWPLLGAKSVKYPALNAVKLYSGFNILMKLGQILSQFHSLSIQVKCV